MVRGKGIKRTETVSDGYPCVRYGEIYTSYNTSFDKTISFIPESLYNRCNHFGYGDIVFTLTGENKQDIAKAITYIGNDSIAAGGDMAYWTNHQLNPFYITYYLSSPYAIDLKRETATGDIIVHISTSKVGSFLIPVPPLNEQERIVKRIAELEPYIKNYNQLYEKINSINTSISGKLKKSILQYAIQGKLVAQNPDDEPASELIKRISAEKEKLIKSGKLKKDKNESFIYRGSDNSYYEKFQNGKEVCIDDEIPFEIPKSWEWCRLGSLVFYQNGYAYSKSDYSSKNLGIPVIKSNNIMTLHVKINNKTNYIEKPSKKMLETQIQKNDLLMCLSSQSENTEPLGKTAIYDLETPALLNQRVLKMTSYFIDIVQWLYFSINSEYFHYTVSHKGGGSAQSNLKLNHVLSMLAPLPPLNEQKRIVNKVSLLQSRLQ